MEDPLAGSYDASERDFLTNWFPFLCQNLCGHCVSAIDRRIRGNPSLRAPDMNDALVRASDASKREIAAELLANWFPILCQDSCDDCFFTVDRRIQSLRPGPSLKSVVIVPSREPPAPVSTTGLNSVLVTESSRTHTSRTDMLQEEHELEDEQELNRFQNMRRAKEYICLERVRGKNVNVFAGLKLHSGVFDITEQKRIVEFVNHLQNKGQKGELGERTYSAPSKWMRGKGRVTMQFGCNYNYAPDRAGNPPGIMRDVAPDPMPHLFKKMIKRLLKCNVLPMSCIPDSCIVNIYEPGDCIPPHIDSHDFHRPFCTVSFLSECNILFGTRLRVVGPGEFDGSLSIPLPVGSVLVLNGNGADIVKHCVPAVLTKRISITFRKMKRHKWPVGFAPDADLQTVVSFSNSNLAVDGKVRKRARVG